MSGNTGLVDIGMPRLSDSMEEATILTWLKRPGDAVIRGEPLVEVETDKATMVYEAETAGVLEEIVVDDGATAELGAVIARIRVSGAAPAPPALAAAAAREGLRPHVLNLALAAHRRALAGGAPIRDRLTIIDYSLASHRPRLWVLDLATGRVLARELVAHGRGSGGDQAHRFSNRSGSLASSLGTFVTGQITRSAAAMGTSLTI